MAGPSAVHPTGRRPRCLAFVKIDSADVLLPSLEAVAQRKYVQDALHATWDLKKGEKILLKADNWHDPMASERVASCRTLRGGL